MSSGNRLSVSIQPLDYADIPTCSSITAEAFSRDPHTTVKNLGQEPYDMYSISRDEFLRCLEKKTYVFCKAVDKETGEIVAHVGWAFRGLDPSLVPWSGPRDAKLVEEQQEQGMSDGSKSQDKKDGREEKEDDPIKRLHALEDADMEFWITKIVPADKPCIFLVGLIVSPLHQSRGVGSALIRHGNAIADNLGLDIWVHSSHQAYEAYKKSGFKTVKELDIDLDEYAPRPPEEGEEVMGEKGSGKWGRYIIRYMKRTPKEPVGSGS
ncbi:acyl-CoA N-acyltransferase [Hypoxylon crocopeplum]|nr:acyl-CoA N-acyltransferase [Hypoxylon crocopeplum]